MILDEAAASRFGERARHRPGPASPGDVTEGCLPEGDTLRARTVTNCPHGTLARVDDEHRDRARSLWLDGVLGQFAPRPCLEGDRDVDVAIVGEGFTGLWTAYALTLREPGLRIAVVEAETAGYGASGRNGGFISAGIAGEARVYSRRQGPGGVARAERAMIAGVDWIGDVVDQESIDCGWVKVARTGWPRASLSSSG